MGEDEIKGGSEKRNIVLQTSRQKMGESLEEVGRRDGLLVEQTSDLGGAIGEVLSRSLQGVGEVREQVTSLCGEISREYLRTGNTPVRVMREWPSVLAATSPHPVLLE